MYYRPRVGMGFFVEKNEQILIVRRKHSHGKGTWAPPGGHLDFNETFEDCALRKVREETGLIISNPSFEGITNNIFEETGKHYITVWLNCKYVSGEPIIGSAREISDIGWYSWNALPVPFFPTFTNFMHKIDQYGFSSFDRIRSLVSKNYLSEIPNHNRQASLKNDTEKCDSFEFPQCPRVGVGLILNRDGKILMLKRTNQHGFGTWAPPGGHMEYGESPEETAIREVYEETGLQISDIKVIGVTNDIFNETNKHYITIWMEGKSYSGEPFSKSPNEISSPKWLNWDEIPQPLFLTFQNFVKGNVYLFPEAKDKYAEILKKRGNK